MKEVSNFYGTQRADLDAVEMTPIGCGPISRSNIRPATGVTSAHVAASLGSASAALSVYTLSSQSAPVPRVPTTVSVSISLSFGLPSSSGVRLSSVPPLPLHVNPASKDFQVPMELIRLQRHAATRLTAPHIADLKGVRNDLHVESATVFRHVSTADGLRSENSHPRGDVSRLT